MDAQTKGRSDIDPKQKGDLILIWTPKQKGDRPPRVAKNKRAIAAKQIAPSETFSKKDNHMLPSTTLKRERYVTVSTPVFNGTRVTVHDEKGQRLGSYGDLSSGRYYVSPSCSLCEDTFSSELEAYEELVSRWECHRIVVQPLAA